MQLMGTICIYVGMSFYWNILIVYFQRVQKDIFTGVYHILWPHSLLPSFLSMPDVSIMTPYRLVSIFMSQIILYFYIKSKICKWERTCYIFLSPSFIFHNMITSIASMFLNMKLFHKIETNTALFSFKTTSPQKCIYI